MADDIVTRLVVQGGPFFINTLGEAALAQQRLIDIVSRAAALPPTTVAENMITASKAVQNADKATEGFIETLRDASPEFEKIINLIARQTKALAENARVVEQTAEQNKKLAEQAAAFAKTIPTGRQTGLVQQAGGFEQQTRNFGTSPANLANVRANFAQTQQAQFINQLVTQQQLADEKLVRGTRIREERRTAIVRQAFNERVKISEDAAQRELAKQKIATGTDFFSQRTGVPSTQLTGFNNVASATSQVTEKTRGMNQAIGETDQVTQKATKSQFTYLGLLSAIHAASFLATGRTFTLLGSFVTLGAAFTRINLAAGLVGLAIGGLLGIFNAVNTALQRIQQVALSAATGFLQLGTVVATAFAAATAASTRLASGVEDTFAEIVAFGEPVAGQLEILDEKISQIARTFGESASDVGTAASQYIRAGGSIAQAIGENAVEAVTKLQVASRGELVPRDAARGIVVLTNAFGAAGVTADKAADIFVGVAQKSALSFSEVFQAFQQAAPQAANIGIPIEELAATIAVLANNGLRGQVAGTGFKQVLIDLVHPSKQARDKLQEYNISLFDTNEKLRPLPVVFAELKRAFGDQAEQLEKTGDASRAQAIAAIFGARANLAASIIARTGAEAFEEMQIALEGVSATDVANILLAPTSAQLRIAKTNVEELARSFGGPLNVAVGAIISQFNSLIQTVDRVHFERAGASLIAVATGQGFGPIIESIDELAASQPILAQFFESLLDAALTARNAFVNLFIPAIQEAGDIIGAAFATVDVSGTFTSISRAIIAVTSAASRFVVFFAQVISDLIIGNTRGQELRTTIAGLVTSIGTTFVGALVATVGPMLVVIKLLENMGRTALQAMNLVNRAINAATASEAVKGSIEQFGTLNKAIIGTEDALKNTNTQWRNVDRTIRDFQDQDILVPRELLRERAALQEEADILEERLQQIRDFKANAARQEIEPFSLGGVRNALEGELPEFFTNLARHVREGEELIARSSIEHEPSLPGFLPGAADKGEDFERTARTIRDLARDTNREIDNLIEDTLNKDEELSRETVRKIADTFSELERQIDKIGEDVIERKNDILENIQDQRIDRQFQENLTNVIDSSERKYQGFIQRRDLLEQQGLAAHKRVNQLRIQDDDKVLSLVQRNTEREFQLGQSLQDRAFQRSQQTESRALTKRQQREEEALQEQLQRESTARDEQRRLAEAKTPEERQQVQLDINRTRQDTQFQEGQETRLKNLRDKHERESLAFSQQQEDQAFQFRLQQQLNEFNFRLLLETKFQQIKRGLEEKEITRENQEAVDLLNRNIQRATIEADRQRIVRIEQQRILDAYQDNTVVPRQFARIDREATKRRRELGTNTIRQIFQALQQADEQRAQNLTQADRQLRTIQQRALERGETLTEQLGRTPVELTDSLDQIVGRLLLTRELFAQNQEEALEFFGILQSGTIGNIANRLPGSDTTAPVRNLPLQGTFLLPENLNIQGANALQLAMPTDFGRILSTGIATGLRLAGVTTDQSRPNQVIIQGNAFSTDDLWRQVNQFLYGQARR